MTMNNDAQWVAALSQLRLPSEQQLEMYARRYGLTVGEKSVLIDREMDAALQEAVTLLSVEDAEWINAHNVVMLHGVEAVWRTENRQGYNGEHRFAMTDLQTLWIYPVEMRRYSRSRVKAGKDEYNHAQMVDWMKRLLQHEIGHVRGYADAEMARRFDY